MPACNQQVDNAAPSPTPTVSPSPASTPKIGVDFVTKAPPTALFVQLTATPLPPPTATPTPTPILYAIQSGDTIWTIAAKSGRNVDEILAMNPGVRPETLQLGQQLQLPAAPTPLIQNSQIAAQPLQIKVLSVSLFETVTGQIWLLGELINEGAFSARNVQLSATLLDPDGAILVSQTVWTALPLIPSGDRSPFGALLPAGRRLDSIQPQVTIVDGESSADLGDNYLDLVASGEDISIENNQVQLIGTISNVGAATAGQILVVATLYQAEGQLSGYVATELAGEIAPGGSQDFALTAASPGGQVASASIMVQGRK